MSTEKGEKEKMQKPKKNTAISIALIAIMITSVAFVSMTQTAKGATNYSTYMYVFPGQPAVGVGQQILIEMYLNAYPPTATGSMGDRWTFYLTITSPTGVNETKGPITSDPVGGAYIVYVPLETGVYTIQASFPGATLTGSPGNERSPYVGNTYDASMSPANTFTVQEEPIPNYTETPIPNDYWTRPVYDTNRGWGNVMMGQWLGGTYYENQLRARGIPNQQGPESSHILWSRSYWTGGIMGGYTDTGYYNGIAYEGFSSPLVVLEGKAYYSVQNPPRYGYYCIDLYTGETIYYENETLTGVTMPTMGQVLNYDSPNQHGGFSYLWRTSGVTVPAGTTSASTWEMLDAFTGNSICKIANVTEPLILNGQPVYDMISFGPFTFRSQVNTGASGTQFRDSIGSICYLNFVKFGNDSNPNYYMQIWNTTQAIWWRSSYGIAYPATLRDGTTNVPNTDTSDNAYWFWRPGSATSGMSSTDIGAIYDGRNGYTMNISVASLYGPRNAIVNQTASVQDIVPDEYVVVATAGQNDARGNVPGMIRAYSLKEGEWGNPTIDITFNAPKASDAYPNATNGGGVSLGGVSVNDGVFWFVEKITGKIWVYSIATGDELWSYQETNQFVFNGLSLNVHNGKVYTIGSFGIMDCFDATTGEYLWNFTAPLQGNLETQGLEYTPLSLVFFIDNNETGRHLVYLHGSTGWAGETSPIRRDGAIFCVDADTGELVWRLTAYPNTANNALSKVIISDDRIMYLDNHDNQIYCLGRGPSATTVSAPQVVPALGSSVTVTGTVTDQSSSGRHNINGDLDFTLKGTPAIGDSYMDAWMEYMFHQRPKPTDATGVAVSLDTIDPNGNFVHIGNTTSDSNGNYGLMFTPEVPGTYRIIASFEGSAAYGPSSATTYLSIGNGPTPTVAPTQAPASIADMYFVPAVIGIVVSIFIVGAILGLLLIRKRP
jgi:outer membrane protein assembly factor BamB